MEIDGTTWVVTGASAGIGEAIAAEATERGARVVGVARREGVAVQSDLFRRFRRLQLMPEIPREQVADELVDAVASGRRAVRLPQRAAVFPWLTSTPQRVVDLLT